MFKQLCGSHRKMLYKYIRRLCKIDHHKLFKESYRKGYRIHSFVQEFSQASSTKLVVPQGVIKSCDVKAGIRLICEKRESHITTVGCVVPGGAMYEKCEERGSSLFMEHLLFRRTANRSQQELEACVQSIGGKLGAIAMRDMFVFYGIIYSCHIDKLIELFADVILHGVVYDADIKQEMSVIFHELKKMETDYEKVLMDYLPNIAYQDTGLGKSIYPETQEIKKLCVEELRNFKDRTFKPCLMTIVTTGGTSLEQLHNSVCKHFTNTKEDCQVLTGDCKAKNSPIKLSYRFSGADLRFRDDDEEVGHVAIGIESPGFAQYDDYCALNVAKEVIGSWNLLTSGANHNAPYIAHTAFNTNICHVYKSFSLNWANTGIWGCYFVCDKMQLEEMLFMLQYQWIKLCTNANEKQVERAINCCKTHEILKLNDPLNRMLDIIIYIIRGGRYVPIQERLSHYENLTMNKFKNVAGEYIYDQCPAMVSIGRIENLPDYAVVRSSMYWLRY